MGILMTGCQPMFVFLWKRILIFVRSSSEVLQITQEGSSLLPKEINYGCKKFYVARPSWGLSYKDFYYRNLLIFVIT